MVAACCLFFIYWSRKRNKRLKPGKFVARSVIDFKTSDTYINSPTAQPEAQQPGGGEASQARKAHINTATGRIEMPALLIIGVN